MILIGLALMAAGGALEVVVHLGPTSHHAHSGLGGEHIGHLVAIAGMVLVLAASSHSASAANAARGRPPMEVSTTMPIGDFVNQIPAPIFLLIHLTAFAVGAYFAYRASAPASRCSAGRSACSHWPRSAT